jgi:hypothetical protein
MNLYTICIFISSLSFISYTLYYFISPKMKKEFYRFGLEKLSLLIISLQFLGALGLIAGFYFKSILILASLGLATLMFFGVMVRIKLKDSIWISLPALFFMALNTYIFFGAIS